MDVITSGRMVDSEGFWLLLDFHSVHSIFGTFVGGYFI